MGIPKMDGLSLTISYENLLKWMSWGYPPFQSFFFLVYSVYHMVFQRS